MPQRHSRNNNDLSHFTYEERRRLGFGTQKERLGKDSIKPFDVCALCIQPFIDPLSCRKGHIFCKECIYSCLLAQKKDIKRKTAAFEAQQKQDAQEREEALAKDRAQLLDSFDRQNHRALPSNSDLQQSKGVSETGAAPSSFHGANSVKSTSFEEEALRTMKAYWLPSATPEAPERAEAPEKDTICPEGREKVRLKELFPLHFTELPYREKKAIEVGGEDRFICPSCSETLTNTTKLSALASCGHVFCRKCVERFVLVDQSCTACGKKCKPRDVVELEKGGTGFSAHGDPLVAASFKHLGSGPTAANPRIPTRL